MPRKEDTAGCGAINVAEPPRTRLNRVLPQDLYLTFLWSGGRDITRGGFGPTEQLPLLLVSPAPDLPPPTLTLPHEGGGVGRGGPADRLVPILAFPAILATADFGILPQK